MKLELSPRGIPVITIDENKSLQFCCPSGAPDKWNWLIIKRKITVSSKDQSFDQIETEIVRMDLDNLPPADKTLMKGFLSDFVFKKFKELIRLYINDGWFDGSLSHFKKTLEATDFTPPEKPKRKHRDSIGRPASKGRRSKVKN